MTALGRFYIYKEKAYGRESMGRSLLSKIRTVWIFRKMERIKQCLKDNNIAYDHVQSENRGSVDRLVKMLINNGYKTIIIVGGDSALNDAVNCLMQVEKEKRDSIVLGVIPNGMMNDFAHFWDFDEDDYEQTVKWLKDRKVRKIDLGCVRYFNKKGDPCRRYFLNCVNIGLIASIMNLRRQTRHFFGSRTLSFFFSFIMMVFQRLEYRMSLKINSDIIDRKVMTMCVGNARGYGQTPNAVPYNGLLDVSVVYHPAMTQLFEGFLPLCQGQVSQSSQGASLSHTRGGGQQSRKSVDRDRWKVDEATCRALPYYCRARGHQFSYSSLRLIVYRLFHG
jgi:diacylglycerol kinase family enzyme